METAPAPAVTIDPLFDLTVPLEALGLGSAAEPALPKGSFGGPCNRSACLRPGADWHNIATDAHYCRECAELINWPGGRADALRLFGRPLLCMPAARPA